MMVVDHQGVVRTQVEPKQRTVSETHSYDRVVKLPVKNLPPEDLAVYGFKFKFSSF